MQNDTSIVFDKRHSHPVCLLQRELAAAGG
jgi:hypothetical protein